MQLFLINVYLELRVGGLWQMSSQVSLGNIYLNHSFDEMAYTFLSVMGKLEVNIHHTWEQ